MNQKGKVNKRKKDPEPSIEDIYQNKHFALQKDKTLETIFEEPKVTRDGVEHFTSVKKYKRYLHFDDCPTAAKLRKRQERAKKVAAVSAHYQGRLTRSRLKEPSGTSNVQDGNSCSSSSSYIDIDLHCLPGKNDRISGGGDWNVSLLSDSSKCLNSELLMIGSCDENSSDDEVLVSKNYKIITAEQQPDSEEISSVITETSTNTINTSGQTCTESEKTSGISTDVVDCNNTDISTVQETIKFISTINEKIYPHIAAAIDSQVYLEENSKDKMREHCLQHVNVKCGESLVSPKDKDECNVKEEINPQHALIENTESLISFEEQCLHHAQIECIATPILHQKDKVRKEHFSHAIEEGEKEPNIKEEVVSLHCTERPEQHTSEFKSIVMDNEKCTASMLEESVLQKKSQFSNASEGEEKASVVPHQNEEAHCNLAKRPNISGDTHGSFQNFKNVTSSCESELNFELKEIKERKDSEKTSCKQYSEVLIKTCVISDSQKHTNDDKDRQTL